MIHNKLFVNYKACSLIDFSVQGNVDDDIVFTYETDTEVSCSCAATLHDEFWVIGGTNKKRQVSIKLSKYFPNIFLVEQN